MSQLLLENLVRELIKTVECLSCKVAVLEAKIDEQTKTIAQLSTSPNEASTTTRNLLTTAPVNTGNAMISQRPQRKARLNATAALTQLLRPAAKKTSATTNHHTGGVSGVSGDSDEITVTTTPFVQPPGITSQQRATKPAIIPDDTEDSNNCFEAKWEVVTGRRRKNKMRKPVVVGTGKESGCLKSVVRTKYIQAWQFKADTTSDQVLAFLNMIVQADYVVEKRQIKSDRHASFIIGIPEDVYAQVTTPTAWPQGIRFANWFFRSRSHPQTLNT